MSTENQQQNKQDFKTAAAAYFRGVKSEWGKVSWPTKHQVIVETIIVLAVVTFFTLVVYFMDNIFIALLGLIK